MKVVLFRRRMRVVGRGGQCDRVMALLDKMIISDVVDMMVDTHVAKEA
jgi:hypothetical protein